MPLLLNGLRLRPLNKNVKARIELSATNDDDDEFKEAKIRKRNQDARCRAGKDGQQSHLALYRFEELPSFLQGNEFIHTGFVVALWRFTKFQAIASFTRIATVGGPFSRFTTKRCAFPDENGDSPLNKGNIWTHLVGFLLFVAMMFYVHVCVAVQCTRSVGSTA
jgi:hypothetical protein